MTGTVGFMDTNNVFSKGHIRGQDYIVLKISTPTLSENSNIYIDQTFTVNKVEAKFKAGVKAEFVQLHFVSNEVLKNVRHRISKAYEDTPSAIYNPVGVYSPNTNPGKNNPTNVPLDINKVTNRNIISKDFSWVYR